MKCHPIGMVQITEEGLMVKQMHGQNRQGQNIGLHTLEEIKATVTIFKLQIIYLLI